MPRLRIVTLVALVILVAFLRIAFAQESITPNRSPTAQESPSFSIAPEQTPSPSPARSVRISFVPPPMEGTISLGIYDQNGKLVRVLHQNAQLNDFAIGADALVTRWDGKDDSGQDLPAGRYHARGYVIGQLKVQDIGDISPPPMENSANEIVTVRLVRNPLGKQKKRPNVELSAAFDKGGAYLKTSDGLPLFKLSEAPNLTRTWMANKGENGIDIWQDDGTKVHQFRLSNLDQVMAFDCGDFELK